MANNKKTEVHLIANTPSMLETPTHSECFPPWRMLPFVSVGVPTFSSDWMPFPSRPNYFNFSFSKNIYHFQHTQTCRSILRNSCSYLGNHHPGHQRIRYQQRYSNLLHLRSGKRSHSIQKRVVVELQSRNMKCF